MSDPAVIFGGPSPEHDVSILTGLHHAMATAAIIRKIVWAEENGYDAVIQSNTFDPGVEPVVTVAEVLDAIYSRHET